MATIYVYNEGTNSVEKYIRNLNEPMPYNSGRTLTVNEFQGSSCSSVMWTTKSTMDAWNVTRNGWGKPIDVGYAFKRIWEGGHGQQSQHYAGVSFDVGQKMSAANRNELRRYAERTGVWSYVEPANLTPTWVHFDKRRGTPACSTGGYPRLARGSRGNYVFVLQDALAAVGYSPGSLDGIFGAASESAVERFQAANSLPDNGVVDCATWRALVGKAVGIGRTATVLDKC